MTTSTSWGCPLLVDTDSVGVMARGEESGLGARQRRRKFTAEFRDEAIKLGE